MLPPDDPGDLGKLSALLPELPSSMREGLAVVLDALSRGQVVHVEPISNMLSTTQAAALLNISRMSMVKLLDEGKLPCVRLNVHRQVRLEDVLAYRQERSRSRARYLQESMSEAEAVSSSLGS